MAAGDKPPHKDGDRQDACLTAPVARRAPECIRLPFMVLLLPQFTYGEKLTVMFSEEVVIYQ